jgi:hypothetical protein
MDPPFLRLCLLCALDTIMGKEAFVWIQNRSVHNVVVAVEDRVRVESKGNGFPDGGGRPSRGQNLIFNRALVLADTATLHHRQRSKKGHHHHHQKRR